VKQAAFIARHEAEWQALEGWLLAPEKRPRRQVPAGRALCFPGDYRRLCQHLALARTRGYSRALTERLQRLVEAGHRVLYQPPPPRWQRIAGFIVAGFPRLVRAEWKLMLVAGALFYVPAPLLLALLQWHPEYARVLFNSMQLAGFERMYDPANEHLGRDSGTDLVMFGHYVWNNVSIAFRSFASGLVFGVGAIYVLGFNGVVIGGVAGHLTAIGYGGPFWRFVVAHSALELTALVIAGAAGLKLGLTLIAPGRQRRGPALAAAGRVGGQLALGAFVMLVGAAFVEAYWSSIASLPDTVKFGSGALLWALVAFWLGWGGRARRHGA